MKRLTDDALHDEIVATRRELDAMPPERTLGRRTASAHLWRLEMEMVRRYEVEMWGVA